jgi:hypothetical protein
MNVYCLGCKQGFKPGPINTLIMGPDVKVSCPFCACVYEGKLTSYVRDLIGGNKPQCGQDARDMIALAQHIELNSSDYYEKRGLRHGGKKKVRDIRN